LNYLKRWAPLAVLIVLFLWIASIKAAPFVDQPDRFWGGKLQAEPATYQEQDELAGLEEYLELEEVNYALRKDHPRSLTIYYTREDGWRRATEHWTCKKVNVAFPKAQLKSLSVVDVNEASRGKTDFDC
jgi:hypothetical protein